MEVRQEPHRITAAFSSKSPLYKSQNKNLILRQLQLSRLETSFERTQGRNP